MTITEAKESDGRKRGGVKMWVPKWYFEAQARRVNELEKRVERLEFLLLEEVEKKEEITISKNGHICKKIHPKSGETTKIKYLE